MDDIKRDSTFAPVKITDDLKYWTDEIIKPKPDDVLFRLKMQALAASDLPQHVNCRCLVMLEDICKNQGIPKRVLVPNSG